MKRQFSACLAVLVCLALLCAWIPESKADAACVGKDGCQITGTDSLQVNDIVTFGSYPYSAKDDRTEIEWIVLAIDGTRATLLSRYVLDTQPYHTEDKTINWQFCSLNKWLNTTFMEAAFSAEEQTLINGAVTIPSLAEAKALPAQVLRSAFTPYALAKGGDRQRCIWWLRDGVHARLLNGEEIHCASVVQEDSIAEGGYLVTFHGKGIRPLIHIDFDRLGQASEGTGLLVKGIHTVTSAEELEPYDDVIFGAYPQSGILNESIHWIVLERAGTKVRLLSLLALDTKPYQAPCDTVAWADSSLSAWLNGQFMDTAFAPLEKALMSDRITLLSVEEAQRLSEEYRIARSTPYAVHNGMDEERCIWWLKDAALVDVRKGDAIEQMYCAAVVLETGDIAQNAYRVDLGHKAIRPVIEVDLSRMPQE